jgi:hypothetical protein
VVNRSGSKTAEAKKRNVSSLLQTFTTLYPKRLLRAYAKTCKLLRRFEFRAERGR